MGFDQIVYDTEDFNAGSIIAHERLCYIEKLREKFLKLLV
jgi:hypothetical protein